MCEVFDEVRREGVKEGEKKGVRKGIRRGRKKERNLIAAGMIKDAAFSTEQIAKYSHLSLEKVNELKQKLQA